MLKAPDRTIYATPVLTVNFNTRGWPAGVTVQSVSVTAENGPYESSVQDPSPSNTLKGAPSVNSSTATFFIPSGVIANGAAIGETITVPANMAVSQQVQNGLSGANYVYRFKVTRTDGGTDEEDVVQRVTSWFPT